MSKRAIIMRGLPGSGKTTYRELHFPAPTYIISADLLRTVNGEYIYRKEDDSRIHNQSLQHYARCLSNNTCENAIIVVDNTNVRAFEFMPYYRLAEAFGWEPEIVWVVADIEMCIARNEHKVPEATIRVMAASFDPLPPWWKLKIIPKE